MAFFELVVAQLATRILERTADRTFKSLSEFVDTLTVKGPDGNNGLASTLPSVSITGLGRCGTNVALGVAQTVFEVRTEIEGEDEKSADTVTREQSFSHRIRQLLTSGSRAEEGGGLFLIDPVILAADFDGDTRARIQRLNDELLRSSIRFQVSDLKWVTGSGVGNVPVVGQFYGMLSLLSSVPKDPSVSPSGLVAWEKQRSYIVDSAGLPSNPTRLFFFVFSAGGGSGSGLASILGTAQHNAYVTNLRDEELSAGIEDGEKSISSDSVCSIGIAVLPSHPQGMKAANAQHLNAGRLLCSFLAQQYRFDTEFKAQRDAEPNQPRRMFNSLLLVSNDLMARAFLAQGEEAGELGNSKAEKIANRYISQQIFNLLTAQATIKDYDSNDPQFQQKLGDAGIDLGDTTRLDAADLANSLSGPAVVAYAEKHSREEALSAVFRRALSPPSILRPKEEDAVIEGISVLPTDIDEYRRILAEEKQVLDMPLFRFAHAVVVVVSSPEGRALEFEDVREVRGLIDTHFPAAAVKRYAFVSGSSPKTSLTLLISGSAFSTDDSFLHFFSYLDRCFVDESSSGEVLEAAIDRVLDGDTFDDSEISGILNDKENLTPTIVGGVSGAWEMKRLEVERQFRTLRGTGLLSAEEFSLDDLLLSKEDVISALKYVHGVEQRKPLPTRRPGRYGRGRKA